MRAAVAGALTWAVVSSLSVYPHSLSYFNELVGGPKHGHWHLANSNTDWGQDLFYLKCWYNENPEARPLAVYYDHIVDPQSAGIDFVKVPPIEPPGQPLCSDCGQQPEKPKLGPQPGWFAIGVNRIHDRKKEHAYFLEFEPVDWIGYSMMVFHITVEDANGVRRKLGLPELQSAEDRGQRAENR